MPPILIFFDFGLCMVYILDENMSMFAGQNGGPYSGSVTNPMMNPMMNNYSQNISAWMAPKQYGILATGVGSARDNILPGNVTKINRGMDKKTVTKLLRHT